MTPASRYNETTIQTLVAGYTGLALHTFAGFTIVRPNGKDWVGHLQVNEATGPGGYLHGGLVYTFMDVIASFLVEAELGPRFYSKTITTHHTLIRSPRVGTNVQFRGFIDRVAEDLVYTRSETWAMLEPEPKLVATGAATKKVQDRRHKPRVNDLDHEALARAASEVV